MNATLFLLGACVGASFAVGLCCFIFTQRKPKTLYALGHVTKGKTYFFRLPLDESEQDLTPEQITMLARAELQDAGAPEDVLERVSVRVSGMMVVVAGEPEDIITTETTHKLWLRQGA